MAPPLEKLGYLLLKHLVTLNLQVRTKFSFEVLFYLKRKTYASRLCNNAKDLK